MSAFTTSDPCDEVMPAYHAALVAIESAVARTETVNTGQYEYAFTPLPDLIAHFKEKLTENKLAVTQPPVCGEGGRVGCATILLHESGQWIEFPPLMLNTGNSPQAAGSAISYTRRYALAAILGIASDDDDGQAAEAGAAAARASQGSAQPRQGSQPRNQGNTQQRASQGRSTGSQSARPAGQGATFRTREEATIRAALAEVQSKVAQAVRQEFIAHFQRNLSDLDVSRHAEALTFVNQAIARATEPQAPESDEEPF